MGSKKSIFEYDDYREFLRDTYLNMKQENPKFSLGYFSRIAGFKSRSVLRQVMAGERNIAAQSIEKYIRAFKMNQKEGDFFKNLVLFKQAQTAEERKHYAEKILSSKRYKKNNPLQDSQYNYFSHWSFVAIRELANLPGFKDDPDWIASQVNPAIKPSEAKHAISELVKLGFLQRDPDGLLKPSAGWLTTTDEVVSVAIAQYHRSMISLAAESIERFPREKRDISAQTFGTSAATAQKIKVMIQDFRKEIEQLVSLDSQKDTVYQLNFQLFPLAEIEVKKK